MKVKPPEKITVQEIRNLLQRGAVPSLAPFEAVLDVYDEHGEKRIGSLFFDEDQSYARLRTWVAYAGDPGADDAKRDQYRYGFAHPAAALTYIKQKYKESVCSSMSPKI